VERDGDLELWRHGAGLEPWRCRDIEISSTLLEACCEPGNVEVFASRAPELWRFAAGV